MSKGTKEMLKTIISNQELIMQHLKIKKPETVKTAPNKTVRKKSTKRAASKKTSSKKH